MEKIFTLSEIESMKNETRNVIKKIIIKETIDSPKTAAELAQATDGLCSTMHIANSISSNHTYNGTKMNVQRNRKAKRTFAELDDNGRIVRTFQRNVDLPNLYSAL